jgi:hypothetical protein
MQLLYSVKEDVAGGWCVHVGSANLHERLTLAQAITRARQLGRKHHERTGDAVAVELVTPEMALSLAHYPR